jgi:hypothetical protein
LVTILNIISYGFASEDILATMLPAVNGVMTVFTCIFLFIEFLKENGLKGLVEKILYKKNFDKTNFAILIVTAISIVVIAFIIAIWQNTRMAGYTNVALQTCVVVAFVPTLRKLQDEDPCPWFLWSVSFICFLPVLLLNQEKRFFVLFYPIGGIIANFAIGLIASKKRKARQVV